jgi:Mn-containing catalase
MTPTFNNVTYRGYTDSAPYPPIRVKARNKGYANILMDDFSGPKGEFTAMSMYFYQHYIAGENTGDYGTMVMRIAIAEMHHMEILAAVIRELGGNPVFRSSTGPNERYWNSRNINYSRDLCTSLQIALEGETNAISSYKKHAGMIDDPFVKNILERIIGDERLHRSYISQMIETYCK